MPPSLVVLRGRWRHLVVDVRSETLGAVYCGRSTNLGASGLGNFVSRPLRVHGLALRREHERCVREYAVWLASPEGQSLRFRIRRDLRGRFLACHCAGRSLACHCEVISRSSCTWTLAIELRTAGEEEERKRRGGG